MPGDLNFKKSWHPATRANLEKVWLAEQKADEEVFRLEQLKKEIKEEREKDSWLKIQEETGYIKKRTVKLDWMYQGPGSQAQVTEDREAYLLGRKKIDLDKNDDAPDSAGASQQFS